MKLTCIIPVKDVNRYAKDAIESIFSQSYTDFTIVFVVYTPSSESLLEVINECRNPHGIQFSILHTSLLNLSYQLNLAIDQTTTEYIARMDIDDISHHDRFQKQVDFLHNNPDISVVGCRVMLIDHNSKPLRPFPFFQHSTHIRNVLPIINPLCHPALMFRSACLVSLGGYRYGHIHEDHALFLEFVDRGLKMYNLPDLLFSYRRHGSQMTSLDSAWLSFTSMCSFMLPRLFIRLNPLYLVGLLYVFPPIRYSRLFLVALLKHFRSPS